MKCRILGGLFVLLLLLPVACSGGSTPPPALPTTPPSNATTPPTNATTPPTAKVTTPPTTQATSPLAPPSVEELTKTRFSRPDIPRITCEQLKQMIDKGDKVVVVDSRDQASFLSSHIAGAISIPDEPAPPVTQQWVTDRLDWLSKDDLIVFYCG